MAQISTYVIDGKNFQDFSGFVEEFNRVFISQFDSLWGGNLDAFNDYLSWPDSNYRIEWTNAKLSRECLGTRFDLLVSIIEDCDDAELTIVD